MIKVRVNDDFIFVLRSNSRCSVNLDLVGRDLVRVPSDFPLSRSNFGKSSLGAPLYPPTSTHANFSYLRSVVQAVRCLMSVSHSVTEEFYKKLFVDDKIMPFSHAARRPWDIV